MNRLAFLSTTFAIKKLYDFSRARTRLHDTDKIPGISAVKENGSALLDPSLSLIFVINHFTRLETLLLPHYIQKLTGKPVWTLAHPSVLVGELGRFLEQGGAVSLEEEDRDRLIVKSLLKGDASLIVFPEGGMIKSKKIFENGSFLIDSDKGRHRPHTGAATLGLRSEFYRKRLKVMQEKVPKEADFLMEKFGLGEIDGISSRETQIVPVNVTYYPLRSRENVLSNLVENVIQDLPERVLEEIMTEGTMILSGVDIDIRFAAPVKIRHFMGDPEIKKDIFSEIRVDFDAPIASAARLREASFDIMIDYMEAIYSGTTLNLDHVIASILALMPFDQVSEYDLKCRVYLAVEFLLERSSRLHLHDSLVKNNISLLTDDRFGRFADFLGFALEKEILVQEGEMLVRNPEKFREEKGFHQVRMENPIEVIANETEPLLEFREIISGVASSSPSAIEARVAEFLIRKSEEEFWADYRQFYVFGASKDVDTVKPFILEGTPGSAGVVLAHGYMAAPEEMRELAEYLNKKGLFVCVPRIKGHGTAPEDLAVRSYMDWLESVEEAHVIMRHRCKKVVLGGFSAGGGIVLDVISRLKDPVGVFAVCPPMKLQDVAASLIPAMDTWNLLMKKIRLSRAVMEFVENKPENPHINYLKNPISGVHELEKLMDDTEKKLPDITIPAIVIQSRKDPVVDPRGSLKLFNKLGSEDREYFLLNFERHGIVRGEGARRVHEIVYDFIRRCTEKEGA